MKNKSYKEMLKIINYDKLILTKPNMKKSLEPREIEAENITETINNPKKALQFAQSIAKKNDLILVTGSCYLIGNILEEKPELQEDLESL